MNIIYCYTNITNNKKYVGQTNNLQRRKNQHSSDAFRENSLAFNSPLERAIRKYGIDNFEITVLWSQDNATQEEINTQEIFWIKELGTYSNGYNATPGGYGGHATGSKKLTQGEVKDLIQELKQGISQGFLAEKYGLSKSSIADINNGRWLKQDEENYPLFINRNDPWLYKQIIWFLKETNYSMRNIARHLNVSKDTIERCNRGETQLAKTLWNDFPIRKVKQGYTLKPVETISDETESRRIIDTFFEKVCSINE